MSNISRGPLRARDPRTHSGLRSYVYAICHFVLKLGFRKNLIVIACVRHNLRMKMAATTMVSIHVFCKNVSLALSLPVNFGFCVNTMISVFLRN